MGAQLKYTVECGPFDASVIFLLIPFSFESHSHTLLLTLPNELPYQFDEFDVRNRFALGLKCAKGAIYKVCNMRNDATFSLVQWMLSYAYRRGINCLTRTLISRAPNWATFCSKLKCRKNQLICDINHTSFSFFIFHLDYKKN